MMQDDDNIYSLDVDEAEELGVDPFLALEAGSVGGGNDAYDAAVELRDYIQRTGNWGTSAHKDQTIAALQARMGMGSDAIGIAGPKTRAWASALGVTLPPKPGSPVTSAPGVTGGVTAMQTGAAVALRDYLSGTGDFGSRAKPSHTVANFQRDMGKLKNDGIVGPKTRARAQSLGVTLPTAKAVVATHAAKLPPAQAKAVVAKHAALPAHQQETAAKVIVQKVSGETPRQYAQHLADYLAKTHSFGSKATPDNQVRLAQSKMGGLKADGIVGPKTRTRAKALGVTLPARPSAPSTTKPAAAYQVMVGQATNIKPVSAPASGAKMLAAYLTRTKSFGSKTHPDTTVAKCQNIMGGLRNDGIVGPKTRARAHALGVTLPQRPVTAGQAHAPGKKTHAQKLSEVHGGSVANQHGVATHMKKSATQIAAKKKLAKLDAAMTAVPEFPLWDTLKFRREVLSLLRVAAGV